MSCKSWFHVKQINIQSSTTKLHGQFGAVSPPRCKIMPSIKIAGFTTVLSLVWKFIYLKRTVFELNYLMRLAVGWNAVGIVQMPTKEWQIWRTVKLIIQEHRKMIAAFKKDVVVLLLTVHIQNLRGFIISQRDVSVCRRQSHKFSIYCR